MRDDGLAVGRTRTRPGSFWLRSGLAEEGIALASNQMQYSLLYRRPEIGKQHEASPSQVALRWVIQHGAVPIPGAKNASQARSNADALTIVPDQSEMDALDQATKNWLH